MAIENDVSETSSTSDVSVSTCVLGNTGLMISESVDPRGGVGEDAGFWKELVDRVRAGLLSVGEGLKFLRSTVGLDCCGSGGASSRTQY